MPIYRIEENRLVIAEELRGQFRIVHDDFGSALAFSNDTLIVFYDEEGTKTFSITPETFKWLMGEFFILEGFLYHGIYKLGKINKQTIRGCSNLYVWDDKKVYYLNGPVTGADPETFEELGNYWARDCRSVFYQHQLIEQADRASFRVFDDVFATDLKHIFGFAGLVVAPYDGDPVPLGTRYYAISGKVYHMTKEVPGADLRTFKTLPLLRPEAKEKLLASGGPQNIEEEMAMEGFHAYDARRKYKGDWSTARETPRLSWYKRWL